MLRYNFSGDLRLSMLRTFYRSEIFPFFHDRSRIPLKDPSYEHVQRTILIIRAWERRRRIYLERNTNCFR